MIKYIKSKMNLGFWRDTLCKATSRRAVVIFGGSILGASLLFMTNPTPGHNASFNVAVSAVASLIAICLSHVARKALLNYDDADMSELFKKASKSAIGSGLALVATAIILSAFIGLFSNFARADTIPYATVEEQVSNGFRPHEAFFLARGVAPGGKTVPRPALTPPAASAAHLPTVLAQTERLWPGHPYPAVVPALIEQESCLSLTHSKCWNSASRLKTEKEEGIGLGQFHQGMEPFNR